MPVIDVYEPALCCDTGVCGPDLDQALVTFSADVDHMRGLGAEISRHNLANDPTAFAENDDVRAFLEVVGSAGLPLTMVDGITVGTGSYPTRDQLLRYARLARTTVGPAAVTELGLTEIPGSSCGSSGCC